MDLEFLDKSNKVTPLLVRLYDTQKYYGLAKDKKPLARVELTDAVCDLLEMDLSSKESALIADVLVELARQAETDLREALAERLSVQDNVPLKLVLHLANDEINVARPMLEHSTLLGDFDLVYIIKSKGAEHWRAIAKRKSIGEKIVNILADTKDLGTAIALVENKNIELSKYTLSALSDVARGEERLATPLLQREEVTADVAAALYKYVGKSLQTYILEHYDVDHEILAEAVDDLVVELGDADYGDDIEFSDASIKTAQKYKAQGILTTRLMLSALKRGQISPFIAQFAEYTELPLDVVKEMCLQKSGQGLAVACKAKEISQNDFVSIYLLTHSIRNSGRMIDLKDMNKAISYFNKIDIKVAQDIMRNSIEQ